MRVFLSVLALVVAVGRQAAAQYEPAEPAPEAILAYPGIDVADVPADTALLVSNAQSVALVAEDGSRIVTVRNAELDVPLTSASSHFPGGRFGEVGRFEMTQLLELGGTYRVLAVTYADPMFGVDAAEHEIGSFIVGIDADDDAPQVRVLSASRYDESSDIYLEVELEPAHLGEPAAFEVQVAADPDGFETETSSVVSSDFPNWVPMDDGMDFVAWAQGSAELPTAWARSRASDWSGNTGRWSEPVEITRREAASDCNLTYACAASGCATAGAGLPTSGLTAAIACGTILLVGIGSRIRQGGRGGRGPRPRG